MRKCSVLAYCLAAVVGIFLYAGSAVAASAPGTTSTTTCAVLDSTCGATDITFVPKAIDMSLSKVGVVKLTCMGTTTAPPAKRTVCNGEDLSGGNEANPNQPCAMTMGTQSVLTDDWTETIARDGTVTLKCTAGGTDKK